MLRFSVLAAALLATTGCLASQPAPESVAPASTAAAPGSGVAESGAATSPTAPAGPLELWPDAKLGIGAAPPEGADAHVTMTDAFNSPMAEGYPVWEGELAEDAAVSDLELRFFADSSSASLAVRTFWPEDIAGVYATLVAADGEVAWSGEVAGPDAVTVAGPVEIVVPLVASGNATTLPAGTPLSLEVTAIYTHFESAAEFRIVIGADHPMLIKAP